MKVTEFFIGFGPRIWSFRRGETEYGLKAIPAGAYVKIIGMNNLDEVDPADEARTYRQEPIPKRLLVAVAGSAMHFTQALVLLVRALRLRRRARRLAHRDAAELAGRARSSPRSARPAEAGLAAGRRRIVAIDGAAGRDLRRLPRPIVADRPGDDGRSSPSSATAHAVDRHRHPRRPRPTRRRRAACSASRPTGHHRRRRPGRPRSAAVVGDFGDQTDGHARVPRATSSRPSGIADFAGDVADGERRRPIDRPAPRRRLGRRQSAESPDDGPHHLASSARSASAPTSPRPAMRRLPAVLRRHQHHHRHLQPAAAAAARRRPRRRSPPTRRSARSPAQGRALPRRLRQAAPGGLRRVRGAGDPRRLHDLPRHRRPAST